MHPARLTRLRAPLAIVLAAALFLLSPCHPVSAGLLEDASSNPAFAGSVQQEFPAPPSPSPGAKKRNHRSPLSAAARWTTDLSGLASGAPASDEAHLFVPLQSGEVVAVALSTGAIAWRVKLQAVGGAAAGGGLVFVPTATSVQALDAATGAARWSAAIESPLSAPLALENGWLLAGTEKGTALMLRASSGERIWDRPLPGKVHGTAAMTGDRLYLPLESRHLLAVTLATGETIWEQRLNGRPTTLAPLDDRLFVGADDKFFYCLSWKTGKVEWRWRTGGPIVGTPAIDDDHVYFLSLDNVLRALDRENGTQAWYASIPFRPFAGPALNARLLIVSGLGEIRAFQVTDGADAGSVEVPEVLAAPPHFLSPGVALVSPFVVITREGQARLLVPEPPPLPSKPFPGKEIVLSVAVE